VRTQLVPCQGAPLGGGDPTRRWGVRCADGVVRWPGLTRPEAVALVDALEGRDVVLADVLVQVELDVVLSDGAGPYLVDADGLLVLVVGPHPAADGDHVAIGQPGPQRARIGAVRRTGFAGGWVWIVRAEVPGPARITALDALAAAGDQAALRGWADRAKSSGIP
jgi:hypothetical protein